MDILMLALQAKKGGSFDEVIKKIDSLVAILKKEQQDDSEKKTYCLSEIDKTEDELKWSDRTISDVKKVIANSKEDLKSLLAELKSVMESIKELDASVDEATKQRKEENTQSTNALAENAAAKQLLELAAKRLNKFYNPALAKEAKKDADESEEATSFVQVRAHMNVNDESSSSDEEEEDDADEATDESNSSGKMQYEKKSEESGGVLHLLESLKDDLSKTILTIELEEKEAQADYEVFMKDSSDKRAIDSKAIADKEAAKAKIETEIQKAQAKLESEKESFTETQEELADLHQDCDWLVKNFDARKEARVDEADALSKARAVLSGADYS